MPKSITPSISNRTHSDSLEAQAFCGLFDGLGDAVLLCDSAGQVVYANPRAAELLQFGAEQLPGVSFSRLLQGRSKPKLPWKSKSLQGTSQEMFLRLRTASGDELAALTRFRKVSEQAWLVQLGTQLRPRPEDELVGLKVKPGGPAGIAVTSLDGKCQFVNRNFAELFGYSTANELIGSDVHRVLESSETAAWILRNVLERRVWTGHLTARKRNGELFGVHLTATLFADETGNPRNVMISILDAANRQATEDALWASEQRNATIVASLLEGIVLQSANGEIIDCNESACRILGLTSDQLMGRMTVDPDWQCVDADGRELSGSEHPPMQALASGQPQIGVVMGVAKPDGEFTWIRVNSRPLFRPDQLAAYAVLTTFTEITQERETQADLSRTRERLEQSRRYLQALVDASTVAFAVIDAEGEIRFFSPAAERITGFSKADVIGRHYSEFALPASRERLAAILKGLSLTPYLLQRSREMMLRADGQMIQLDVLFQNLLEEPAVQGFLVHFSDVTESVRQTQELADSHEYFAALVSSIEGIIWEADVNTLQFTFVSEHAERILGYPVSEWLEPGFFARVIHPSELKQVIADCRAFTEQGLNHELEYRLRARDGRYVWIRDLVSVVQRNGAPHLLRGLMIDISQRKRMEQALRDSEQLLEETGRVAEIGGWSYDLATRELRWTAETRRIFEVAIDYPPSLEFLLRHFAPESQLELQAALEAATTQGTPWDLELPLLLSHDRRRVVRWVGRVILDQGRPLKLYGTCQDITRLRATEQEQTRLQSQLLQARRMESLGRLAGGIAHDFNNILVVILNYVEVLRCKLHSPEEIGYLEEIKMAVQRATNLIQRLQAYARKQPGLPEPLNVAVALQDLYPILKSFLGSQRELVIACSNQRLVIRIDPLQFEQVITNLIANARDATGPNGKISIRGHLREMILTQPSTNERQVFVRVSVTDNGAGIPPENMGHLFEPFFSTKQLAEGAGMGLATVYGIVTQAGGMVHVESQVGAGATFHVDLPLCDQNEPSVQSYQELLLAQSS